jgi:hypothetical protein
MWHSRAFTPFSTPLSRCTQESSERAQSGTAKAILSFSLPLQDDTPAQDVRRQLSGSSLALICIFFSCFIGIVYLTSKTPRAATTTPMPVFPASPPTRRRFTAGRRRPRLWEIWLDEYLGGTVHNWRVSHPCAFPKHID